MKKTKHILIGGGLASSQALKMILQKDPGAPVTLVTAESHPPYDRPPLSKELMRGETSADDVLYDPLSFYDENNVDVRLESRVTAIDPSRATVSLDDGKTIGFERALIATGGTPIRPAFDRPLAGVHYLRTLDGLRLRDYSGWRSLQEFLALFPGRTSQNVAS